MKVVINKCYGGFSLSREAAEWMQEQGHEGMAEEIEQHAKMAANKEHDLSKYYRPGGFMDNFSGHDISRHDTLLVACVEALGEKASGSCASLEVIEIPDSIEYIVEEYDGQEWIAEKHQTWS